MGYKKEEKKFKLKKEKSDYVIMQMTVHLHGSKST